MQAAIKNFGLVLTTRETDLLIAEATFTGKGSKAVDFETFRKVLDYGSMS